MKRNMYSKILKILLISIFFILIKSSVQFAATSIPKVYFEGNITDMLTKEDERNIYVKFTSSNINFEHNAKLKIQGSSSLGFEKKNYNITFYKDETYKEKQKVDVGMGWGEQSKYCLKANWIDKTHSRNIVSARISAKVQEKYNLFKDTPNNGVIDGFPIEIYSNNEFLGLYTWNIPKSSWLWGLNEDNPNNIALVGDDWTQSVAFKEQITTFEESKWECEVGNENQETIDKFNRLINFVNNSSDEEFKNDFNLYLNKDATLNYIVMLYIMEASDNYGKNMIMVTYDGKIWYPSLYDLDSTWGTWSDGSICENYDYIPDGAESKLLTRTINCFSKELANRWFELRNSILSKDNILKEFDTFINSIPEEVYNKEHERWGAEIPGYDINQISEFLDYRLKYIDDLMNSRLKDKEEHKVEALKKENYIDLLIFVNIIFVIVNLVLFFKNYKKYNN